VTAIREDGEWRRLSTRMLLIHPIQEIPRALPALIGVIAAGGSGGRRGLWAALAVAIPIALGMVRWFTTRYRVTPDRVEVERGLFNRRLLAVSRDRLRTVDASAHILHRALGLSRVTIGTGRSDREGGGSVRLDGLTTAEASDLREILLHRVAAATAAASAVGAGAVAVGPPEGRAAGAGAREAAEAAGASAAGAASAGAPSTGTAASDDAAAVVHVDAPETELAHLDSTWIRFAPFTLSGAVAVGAVAGFLANATNEADLHPSDFGPLRDVVDWLDGAPLTAAVAVLAVAAIAAVAVASTVGYVLAFWDFRLTRNPRGTLHVTRGLLTTRATTIEERRLHGVEISEPLLLRLVRGARCLAIATGLRVGRGAERGGSLLLPPAPRAEAQRVGAAIVAATEPLTCALTEHGPRARTRRYTRALDGWAVVAAALAVPAALTSFPAWPALVVVVLLPPILALAADRYRSLGHAVAGSQLVARGGSLIRRRHVLGSEGIIGWNLGRTFFQRRAGLVTLTATTAAGRQRYDVQDVELDEALGVAEALLPGLLEPFVERPASGVSRHPRAPASGASRAAPPATGP
jgi:putative membrane protein